MSLVNDQFLRFLYQERQQKVTWECRQRKLMHKESKEQADSCGAQWSVQGRWRLIPQISFSAAAWCQISVWAPGEIQSLVHDSVLLALDRCMLREKGCCLPHSLMALWVPTIIEAQSTASVRSVTELLEKLTSSFSIVCTVKKPRWGQGSNSYLHWVPFPYYVERMCDKTFSAYISEGWDCGSNFSSGHRPGSWSLCKSLYMWELQKLKAGIYTRLAIFLEPFCSQLQLNRCGWHTETCTAFYIRPIAVIQWRFPYTIWAVGWLGCGRHCNIYEHVQECYEAYVIYKLWDSLSIT